MNWLKRLFRRGDPVTFDDDNMLRVRMTAKGHLPRAEYLNINNPRLLLKRRKMARS